MDSIGVLLVDDHPVVREGLHSILATVDDIAVVGEANDGLEAVSEVTRCHPNVVLMDLRMPNLDGLEAIRRIQKEFPETKVIVLTVYSNDAYVVGAVKAGAKGYLLKDATKDLVIHTVRAVHSGGVLFRHDLLQSAMANLNGAADAHVQSEQDPLEMGGAELLTGREREALQLVVDGCTNKQVGDSLVISEETAKKHVQSVMAKLGATSRTQAAVRAVRLGLVH